MDDRLEEKTEHIISSEADQLRASAQAHKEALKSFWTTFAATGVIVIVIAALIIRGGLGWFLSNNQVNGATGGISAAGQGDFTLATVGNKSQGVYDSTFQLTDDLITETIGGKEYYIASGNSSFRVDSDKNFNNYLANADLRPGNRGSFDLYVICRTGKRDLVLSPIFSAWHETDSAENQYQDALNIENSQIRAAAEFLKGHILLFASMDDKGMYSGNIDFTQNINVNLTTLIASQHENREFQWGEIVYSNDDTAVYRLPVYWVWPEQFGNFIYTGNSYNKNLFASKESKDYEYFISAMESDEEYKKFFYIEGGVTRPPISTITSSTDYNTATQNYELYSSWYNAADEEIGTWISYIQLGFEIAQDD